MAEPEYITGIDAAIKAVGKKLDRDMKYTINEGLKKCAEVILKKALKYVPVDTGALKASGRVEVEGQAKGSVARVVFGGTRETFYALYVHENLEAKHEAPTCAKFLERACRETAGTCASIVAYTLETNKNHATKVSTATGEDAAYQTQK